MGTRVVDSSLVVGLAAMFMRLFFMFFVFAIGSTTAWSDQREPYNVVDVTMEEPHIDALELQGQRFEAQAETRRMVESAELGARARAQQEAALATQHALSVRIEDIVRQAG